MRRSVVSFAIELTAHLGRDGVPLGELPEFARDPDELVRMYRAMVFTRTYDAKAVALQRTGRIGTFGSSLGQEAVSVGVGAAMRDDDVLVPSFREQGAQFLRGVSPAELFFYWGGDERGSDFRHGPARHDFPNCVPIGTQAAHATGAALAFQLRGEERVAVCVLGDGATSRGDVHESMNFAGIRALPVVFVVNDNQWAISLPRRRQSAAATLAQKAIGAGIPGEQVDGNDVIAVRDVVGAAIERARRGEGPTLVECLTYRLTDHTTADDASRYRSDDEVSEHWKDEPVGRLRAYLVSLGVWDRDREERLLAECADEVERGVVEYEGAPARSPVTIFEHLFEELPEAYRAQRDALTSLDEHGNRVGGERDD